MAAEMTEIGDGITIQSLGNGKFNLHVDTNKVYNETEKGNKTVATTHGFMGFGGCRFSMNVIK